MPVFDIQGQVLSIETVQGQLRKITQMVNSTPSEQYQPPVGVMTSEHRDTWARVNGQHRVTGMGWMNMLKSKELPIRFEANWKKIPPTHRLSERSRRLCLLFA